MSQDKLPAADPKTPEGMVTRWLDELVSQRGYSLPQAISSVYRYLYTDKATSNLGIATVNACQQVLFLMLETLEEIEHA